MVRNLMIEIVYKKAVKFMLLLVKTMETMLVLICACPSSCMQYRSTLVYMPAAWNRQYICSSMLEPTRFIVAHGTSA